MAKPSTPKEDLQRAIIRPWEKEAQALGVTIADLARRHKEELDAEEPKYIKIKKSEFDPIKFGEKYVNEIKRGAIVIIETGAEVLIRLPEPDWEVRQVARRDWEIKLGLTEKEDNAPRVTVILKPERMTKPKNSGRYEGK